MCRGLGVNQALIQQLAAEFGFDQVVLDRLRQTPFEQARKDLEAVKVEARKRYRKLAFKYHPDRNQGNPEAEDIFKALAPVLQRIEALQVHPPRPQVRMQPMVVQFHSYQGPSPFSGAVNFTTTSSTTTSSTMNYQAHRVVFIRPV